MFFSLTALGPEFSLLLRQNIYIYLRKSLSNFYLLSNFPLFSWLILFSILLVSLFFDFVFWPHSGYTTFFFNSFCLNPKVRDLVSSSRPLVPALLIKKPKSLPCNHLKVNYLCDSYSHVFHLFWNNLEYV